MIIFILFSFLSLFGSLNASQNIRDLMKQRTLGISNNNAFKKYVRKKEKQELKQIHADFGWRDYPWLSNSISAGECPPFSSAKIDNAQRGTYPPTRVIQYHSDGKVKEECLQDFNELLITSITSIHYTLEDRDRFNTNCLLLDRTNIKKISKEQAESLHKHFPNLKAISLAHDITKEQRSIIDENFSTLPQIKIVYANNNSEKGAIKTQWNLCKKKITH